MIRYNDDSGVVEKYRESIQYRMVCILAAYRRIACLTGTDFSEKLRKIYAQSEEKKDCIVDKSFLILIECGYIALSESDVQLYAQYICDAYGYDFDEFYELLRNEAGELRLVLDYKTNNRAIVDAIMSITMCLNSCDKGD